jgi:iron complex outermembrane receptor protein
MRATLVAAAVGLALLGVAVGAEAQSASARVSTHIPPEPLGPALRSLAQQFGFQIVYPSKDIASLRTPGVTGSFTLEQALQHALAGTGLTYRYVDLHTITVLPIAQAAAISRDPPSGALERLALVTERPAQEATDPASSDSSAAAQPQDPPQATASAAGASSSSSAGAAPALQEVIVTGTSIRGGQVKLAVPLQVLTSQDIARTGATNVPQLLQEVSAASSFGSTTTAQATGFQTAGISTVSLHGLGSARTLVLVNGLRMPVYGGGSAGVAGDSVDINAIPIEAIQRVEVLENGDSAIYGSNAIGGVVNFILKSDFQGLSATATAGTPTQAGGGTTETASVYAGIGSLEQDRYNVGIGLEYDHMTPIMGASRPFATRYSPGYGNDVTSALAFPANVVVPPNPVHPKGALISPMAGNCQPYSDNSKYYPTQCRFDNSPYDSLQPEQKRYNAYLNGAFRLTDSSQLYGNALFSQVKTTTFVQPVPLGYFNPLLPGNPYIPYLANLLATQYPGYSNPAAKPGSGAFLLGPSSPYYPTAWAAANGLAGQPLNLVYRDFANGIRRTVDTANTTRVVGGIKGEAAGWSYNGSALYSSVNVSEDLESGYALYSKMMPLLDSGVINPFGATADPAALAAASGAEFYGQDFSSKTSLSALDGSASRVLTRLPGGPLSMAAGAEVRRDTFEYSPALAIQTGDISGEGGNQLPESASRTAEAAYLEFNGYVLKSLEADAAVRYDHYQQVGSTVNPQFSLRWQPWHWFQLRGSAGTGFRAPSLTDLYSSRATSVTSNGTRDPIQCPTFSASNPACSFQFTTVTGGNPDLKPEKSRQFTLGTVLEPVRNLRIGLDSFWVYLRDAIAVGGLSYSYILQNAQNATQYASFITRDAQGNIVSINQTNANLFKQYVSGMDVDLSYRFRVGPGNVFLRGNGTYYYTFSNQNANGTWTSDINVGLPQVGGVVVRWRHNLTIGYTTDSWEVSATQHYQEPYYDVPSDITNVPRTVSAYDTFDAQASYLGLRHFDFTLGVINAFNQNPPYANYASSANNFVGGYDLTYGDPRGRYVYATIQYNLH